MKSFLSILSILLCAQFSNASDLIFNSKVATSLNKISLYADSSYSQQTSTFFEQGELFEVIGESFYEHEDDAQNQKFKWYQVKTEDGKTGWLFGDGIAVIVEEAVVDAAYKSLHKKRVSFSDGFEKSVVWIGEISGHDNFEEQDYLNPAYIETYLVITNERGKSAFVNISGESAMGKSTVDQVRMLDVTNDGSPEILIEKSTFSAGNNFDTKSFIIQSVQAGTVVEILNEVLTLEYTEQIPSPALSKVVEVSEQTIRVAYVDYVSCDRSALFDNIVEMSKTMERCIEYVTYTYHWNDRRNNFDLIYPESRDYIIAGSRNSTAHLYQEPSVFSKKMVELTPYVELKLVKHYETIDKVSGSKKVTPFFMVQVGQDKMGYVQASQVGIVGIEHAAILNKYYSNPPLSKLDWKVDQPFLKIISNTKNVSSSVGN